MRIVLVALVVLYLGTIQTCSSVALRDRATAVSLPRFAPALLVHFLEAQDPGIALPEELRLVLGAYALHRGATRQAAEFAASLHAGPDRRELDGAIAEATGADTIALTEYLAAGDFAHLEDRIDALAKREDFAHALRLQSDTIAMLEKTGAQNDTMAEAYYRSGLVFQADAYKTGTSNRAGASLEVRSRDAYARAVALAPLEERYTIALANQDLNIGDFDGARATFSRLNDMHPKSIEAATGFADLAIRTHNLPAAISYLNLATKLDPQNPAIARLRAEIPR